MSTVAALVLFFALLGSGCVWSALLRRWKRGGTLLPGTPAPPPPVDSILVLFAFLLWLGLQVVMAVVFVDVEEQATRARRMTISSLLTWGAMAMLFAQGIWARHRKRQRQDATAAGNSVATVPPSLAEPPPAVRLTPVAEPAPFSEDTFALSSWSHKLRQDLLWGVGGFWASLLPVGLMLLATSALRKPEHQHQVLKSLRDHPSGEYVFWACMMAILAAPLLEELLYRVLLIGALLPKVGPWSSVLISSLIFAAMHGIFDALPLLPLAMILGLIYAHRGRYLSVVITHALFNALNIALVMLG